MRTIRSYIFLWVNAITYLLRQLYYMFLFCKYDSVHKEALLFNQVTFRRHHLSCHSCRLQAYPSSCRRPGTCRPRSRWRRFPGPWRKPACRPCLRPSWLRGEDRTAISRGPSPRTPEPMRTDWPPGILIKVNELKKIITIRTWPYLPIVSNLTRQTKTSKDIIFLQLFYLSILPLFWKENTSTISRLTWW